MTPFRKACIFTTLRFVKTHALRLSRTKNLHFAIAPFPRFSASETELQEAMIARPQKTTVDELPELGNGIDIQAVLEGIKLKYIKAALQQTAGNKKEASDLLGLPNYQTLTNWLQKAD